jgi:hypothetical protein
MAGPSRQRYPFHFNFCAAEHVALAIERLARQFGVTESEVIRLLIGSSLANMGFQPPPPQTNGHDTRWPIAAGKERR